jgi:hypothetical protein
MDSSTPSKDIEGGIFDVDQVDQSTLYANEEEKLFIASLPELQREQIIGQCLEHLKKIKEMSSALALAHRCSEVVDEKDKIYVPVMFRSPDYHSISFFKDTNNSYVCVRANIVIGTRKFAQ